MAVKSKCANSDGQPHEIPMKIPNSVTEKPTEKTFDRFRPDMPQIPGVVDARPQSLAKSSSADRQRLIQLIGAATGAIAITVAIFWWFSSATRRAAASAPRELPGLEASASQPPSIPLTSTSPGSRAIIATTDELSKPWSSKTFIFAKPLSGESINAMVVRLPGGDLWAFSLQEPYGRCELQLVTDLGQIQTRYGYRASHPMVLNPCSRTLYDPLKMGSLAGSTWTRGEIVQGGGLRPPISIEVEVKGHSIIATRME
jgi:hypothetical protein